MRVSLIIPTYNRGAVLCKTIAMSLNQTHSDYEVIVVDQTASVDPKVRAYVDSLGDRIRYCRLSKPNLPAARNAGVRLATGEVLIFIDDDVRIPRDYVASCARNFEDASVGGVTGLTLNDANEEPSKTLAAQQQMLGHSEGSGDNVVSITWINGCNASYRRCAILDAGSYDEHFSGSGLCEDADMAVSVRQLGYKLLLDSRIRLVHLALPSGGCRNRDAGWMDKRDEEHLQLYMYFVIKSRRAFGTRGLVKGLLNAYRRYSFNRNVIRQGISKLTRRHVVYLVSVVRAYQWSFHKAK